VASDVDEIIESFEILGEGLVEKIERKSCYS
jgi:hypothetical protein